MQNRRLIDEAISQNRVKNSFRLAWEFMVVNREFTFTAMSLLLLLNILSAFLGLLALVLSGIFSMALQIYIAKLFYTTQNIESFVEESKKAKVEDAVKENFYTAMGAYLGTIVVLLGLLTSLLLGVQSMGISLENIKSVEELQPLVNTMLLPLTILLLLMSYIYPLVQANIAMAQNFKEGFQATFSMFSLSLWQRSFRNGYFQYIALFMLVVMVGAFILVSLLSIPFISILANFIVIVVMYGYMVLMAVASMMSKRVVES